jgi:hypothetical protein
MCQYIIDKKGHFDDLNEDVGRCQICPKSINMNSEFTSASSHLLSRFLALFTLLFLVLESDSLAAANLKTIVS